MTVKYNPIEARNFSYKIWYAIRWTFGYLFSTGQRRVARCRAENAKGQGWGGTQVMPVSLKQVK